MNNRTVSSAGAWGCMALAALMALGASMLFHTPQPAYDFGLCFPSPELWPIDGTVSRIINFSLIILSAAGISILNKKYSLIKGTDHVLTSLFAVLCAGNPFISSHLTSAMIVLPAVLAMIWVLFSSYKGRNSTQQVFVIATFLSVGSMLQYAFVPLIPAALVSAIIMKCLRFKEICAFMLGLIAPWWVVIGLGIVPPTEIHFPAPDFVIHSETTAGFVSLAGNAVLLVATVILSLGNMVRLYAGNSRIRSENNVVNLFGAISAICIALDYNNMGAYYGIFYFWAAAQFANLFALNHIRKSWVLYLILIISILTFTILTIAL